MEINKYIIIYGYDDYTINIIKQWHNNKNYKILLIEPLKKNINEIIQLQKEYKFKLNKKYLINDDKQQEIDIYENEIKSKYYIQQIKNCKKRYKVFTTSLDNIIEEYKIDIISNIYINMNISNLKTLLDNWCKFNYIIERITLPLMTNQEVLNNLFFTFFEENISLQDNNMLDFQYIHYIHKNLMITKPKILIYELKNTERENNVNFNRFFKIYSPIIQDIEEKETQNCVQYLHERILEKLEKVFQSRTKLEEIDIIIQIDKDYFNNNKYFQINYPIQDTILYINKYHNIIYSTKNCMHMLYEILKSKYFKDYIKENQENRKKLFKFFEKRIFYEYLHKIFKVIEI